MAELDRFLTLEARGEAETRVRGSRFLALAFPAKTQDEARGVLDDRARTLHDASHHCAAWRFRDGDWRALDAGEPSGSAGAPILAAIDTRDLVDVAVVVTRYFGGTKLGVGGLARAYGEGAAAALDMARKRQGIAAVRLELRYPYDLTSVVMRAIERYGAQEVDHGYGEHGLATIQLTLPAPDLAEFNRSLRDESAGALEPRLLARTVLYGSV